MYHLSLRKAAIIILGGAVFLSACKNKPSDKSFEVSGAISNAPATMIYLDEVPLASMQRMEVDSAKLGTDGKYSLKVDRKEACVYNLRIGKEGYPFAAVINDTSHIIVNAVFNKSNNGYADSYLVTGSEASQDLKDFITQFTKDLQSSFFSRRLADSLKTAGANDSVVNTKLAEGAQSAAALRQLTQTYMEKSSNPALTMFELGYYQSTANNREFKVEPLSNEEVSQIVSRLNNRFPAHQGVAAIKGSLDAQMNKMQGWVGQQAPEFKLPDVNGKEISLSSFKGKYVLVDFWASWCDPCRRENPNVVKAYEKFKDKNFAILGVSLDHPGEKDAWTGAIKDDHLTWTQVSDLQFWDSPVVALYRIEGIPYNVLVDPQGKIVAEGLHGGSLERKLTELVK